jgi:SEL1 protein
MRYALKILPSFRISAPPQDAPKKTISPPLRESVRLLEEAASMNNTDALYMLAQFNFYGNYSYPRSFPTAFEYYQKLASLDGNSSAMYMLATLYSTGVGGGVERDQAKALLYYTFAANSGHTRAEMALAYRHHAGISTPRSCETALKYYKRVADKSFAWYRSGPPGGMAWIHEAFRITDETGGLYGEGASVSSSGINAIRGGPTSETYASIDDIIEYLDLMAQKGDFKAAFNLGRIYYDGERGLERNFELSRKYLMQVVTAYWKKGGKATDPSKPGLTSTAARAAGLIGHMYLRGEGVVQSPEKAEHWFKRGSSEGDAHSRFSLGQMALHGMGNVEKNVKRATDLFKAASDNGFGPAQVEMAVLHLDQGTPEDANIANIYLEKAVKYGIIEAYYYLAEMTRTGVGRDKSCNQAVNFYKSIAETTEPLVSSWAEANLAYEEKDYELALLGYLHAAEQGYEKAQNNVAWILDQHKSLLPIPDWLWRRGERSRLLSDPSLALIEWSRSSNQGNIDSLVRMGDYYLHGTGTTVDVDKAVQCYTGASEYQQSAQALFNLGWMHENGVGLTQDFHLAKRYYDHALETNKEAYLPVTMSLLKLRARSAWNTFTHGRVNSIQDEPGKVSEIHFILRLLKVCMLTRISHSTVQRKDWSLSEWIANFLEEDMRYYDDEYDYDDDMFDDAAMTGGGGGGGGAGAGDGGATNDVAGDEDDGGVIESLIILALAASLIFLMIYRNYRQEAARRREEERRRTAERQQQQAQPAQPVGGAAAAAGGQAVQQQPAGPGAQPPFPIAGAPDGGQWAAGGIGH